MEEFLGITPRLFPMGYVPFPGAHDVERIRQEICTLDEAIARLVQERHKRLALISPLHHMPLELLGEVFAIALGEHLRAPTLEGMKQLIDLCLVCQRWRAVAIGTPALWSTLVLESPFTPFACSQTTQWLSRSKEVPKALTVDSSAGCSEADHCQHRGGCALGSTPLATLLTDGPAPLRHLSLTCARSLCLENLQRLLSEAPQTQERRPWDTVTTLTLDPLEYWNHYEETGEIYDEYNSDYPILENLPPSITRLNLHITDLPESEGADEDSLYILKLPDAVLNRLTHFTLSSSMNATTIFGVLASCRNVQVLCLDLEWMWSNPDESQLSLDEDADLLPALRNLQIKSCRFDAVQYFRAFRTPCLQKLEIRFVGSPPDDGDDGDGNQLVVGILGDYFDRSQCHSTLTHLQLHRAYVKDFYPVLIKLTSLTHLALDSVGPLCDKLFRNLAERHRWESNKPLPVLKSLSLQNISVQFSLQPLWAWIQVRRRSGMDELEVIGTQRCGRVREVDSRRFALPYWSEFDLPGWEGNKQCEEYQEGSQWGLDEIFL